MIYDANYAPPQDNTAAVPPLAHLGFSLPRVSQVLRGQNKGVIHAQTQQQEVQIVVQVASQNLCRFEIFRAPSFVQSYNPSFEKLLAIN